MGAAKPNRPALSQFTVRPWALVRAAGAVTCVATLLGFCGRFGWLFDLFSHFRVQYFLGLATVAALLLIPRQRKTAIGFALVALINLAVILPLYFGRPVQAHQHSSVLRAMLLNVNTTSGSPTRVRRLLDEVDPQLLVLEEISSRWVTELEGVLKRYPHACVRTREDNFGIGLFSKLPLTAARVVAIGEAALPSIVADVAIGNGALRVIATHPPPPAGAIYSRWRNDQLDRLADHVATGGAPTIILGDLNATPWSHHFNDLLSQSGLQNSSRGRGVQPTWPTHFPPLWIPLDHCLHSPGVVIVRKEIGPDVGSDHYPVIVDLAIRDGTASVAHRHVDPTLQE